VGTSITATTDASGRFTLSGIPTGNGNVALRFQGQGIDATLQISGLTPGQTLQISVQLSGNNATLDDDDDNEGDGDQDEVEFTGAIDSIADPTLVVAGRTVVTDSSTRITDGGADTTLSALTVGMMVEVEGALQADGSVLAERIKVVNGDGDQDDGEDDDGDEEEDLV
jgi:hypothetical protein